MQALASIAEIFKRDMAVNNAENPCLCGSKTGRLIVNRDKYGIPLTFHLCRKCGTIRIDPYLSEAALTELYNGPYRDLISPEIEELYAREVSDGVQILKFLRSELSGNKEPLIVEVGCGAGGILKPFKEAGYRVLGFDLDQRFLARGQADGLDLSGMDAGQYMTQHNLKADLVILNHVLEHIQHPTAFVQHLARCICKPGGYLYIAVPGVLGFPQKHYPNYLLKYFVFAHPWSFTLKSLCHGVFNNSPWRLVRGSEDIEALFQLSSEQHQYKPVPQRLRITMTLLMLRARELLRGLVRRST